MPSHTRVRLVGATRAILGESPVWDERTESIYWVDIESGTVNCRSDADGGTRTWSIGQKIGCLSLRRDRPGFIAGLQSSIAICGLDPLQIETIAAPEAGLDDNRCNDGKCDAAGRFWMGTCDQMGIRANGYLYRVDANHTVARVAGPFICTNGPAFSPDQRTLYCVDTYGRKILAFDVDPAGALSRGRVLIRFEDQTWGYPDGLTCDSIGCLWVAHWGGSRISRFSANGELLEAIPLPVSQATSCVFGGHELKTLFVTSASLGLPPGKEEAAGALLAIDVDVAGSPTERYAG